jgi:hypothetical protein
MYETLVWLLLTFICGAVVGGYLVNRMIHAGPLTPHMTRRGFQWARSDIRIPPLTAENTMVRKVTDWQNAPELNVINRTLTFHLFDTRTGLERDLTYSAAMVLRLFKCDTPCRREWHGDTNEYTRLLAIGKSYGWLIPEPGKRYGWASWLATRERRLRILESWLSA